VRLGTFGRPLIGETGQTFFDVSGIADLAVLAVTDDVDPDVDLPLYDIDNRLPNSGLEFRGARIGIVLAAFESGYDGFASRETADMGSQNSVLTLLQCTLPTN
jgi:hypothetical protein